jgi:hypothetical protein
MSTKPINVPGFTANTSLDPAMGHYQAVGSPENATADSGVVLPQKKKAIIFRWPGHGWCVGVHDDEAGQSYVAGCADTAGWA